MKAKDVSAENYWHAENSVAGIDRTHKTYNHILKVHFQNLTDNYYLTGSYIGEHKFLSEWQEEKGPRLFDPMFGFYYKAINTQFKVSLIKESGQYELILDIFIEKMEETDSDGGWNYFSKNLSQVDFLVESWNSDDPTKWQVKTNSFLPILAKKYIIIILKILVEINVGYHGEFSLAALGRTASGRCGSVGGFAS